MITEDFIRSVIALAILFVVVGACELLLCALLPTGPLP